MSEPTRVADMQLMDAGLNFAHRIRGGLQRSGVDDLVRFTLPVWVDKDGAVRIALPVEEPCHGTDVLQLIIPLEELLTTVGHALGEERVKRQVLAAIAETPETPAPEAADR